MQRTVRGHSTPTAALVKHCHNTQTEPPQHLHCCTLHPQGSSLSEERRGDTPTSVKEYNGSETAEDVCWNSVFHDVNEFVELDMKEYVP